MRAAVADASGRLVVRDVARPLPGPGEVLVAVEACGVCGSDLHASRRGRWPEGFVPGHEIVGRVVALGDGDDGDDGERTDNVPPPDTRVVVDPIEACGRCPACREGRESICPELRLLGVHRPGGFAEALVVSARRLHPVPRDLDPAIAALAEPLAVALHALERGALARGERVLVLGGGPLGLLCAHAARQAGAAPVHVRARHASQRALAERALGASASGTERSIEADGLADDWDLVIETVGGEADTLIEAVRAARPGARIVVLGLFEGSPALEPWGALEKELSLLWSNCQGRDRAGRPDLARALAILDRDRDALAALVTHRVGLESIDEAFRLASRKREGAGRVVVVG